MTTKKDTSVINLPEIKIEQFTLNIIGDSPLIVHNWSQKAKLEMLNKQKKKAATAK